MNRIYRAPHEHVPRATPGAVRHQGLAARVDLQLAALEGVDGVLYAQGTTSYSKANPFEAIGPASSYPYPGPSGPIPSARLEQLRDGIEDWAIFNLVRARRVRVARDELRGGCLARGKSQAASAVATTARARDRARATWT